MSYRIVRYYFNALGNGRHRRVIATGLTLEQAQEHCNDPQTSSRTCTNKVGRARTRKIGQWFDAYEEEK